MMTTTEALEQPGKVVAWALLGLAVAAGWSRTGLGKQAAGQSLQALAQWFRQLRAAARHQPWRERAAWIALGTVMICAAVLPSVARDRRFTVQTRVSVQGGPVVPGADAAPYLSKLLADPTFQYETALRAESAEVIDSLRELSVPERGRSGVGALRATSPTPARARSILAAAAVELPEASARDLRARVAADLQRVEGLVDSTPQGRHHRALLRQRSKLRALLASAPQPVRVARIPLAPEPRRDMDRFADALPGPFPQRPDPVPLALVLAGVLLLAWLVQLASRVRPCPSNGSIPGSTASASSSRG
jgi:hypothetical protein